jgi:hypothetical protein
MDKSEIIANVKKACDEYRQVFTPPYLFLKQVRREEPNEEFRKADITLRTKGEHCQSMAIAPKGSEAITRAVFKNPKYSFAIRRGPDDSTWVSNEIFPKGSGDLYDNLILELHFLDSVLHAPTYVNHLRIDDLLDSPAVVASAAADGDEVWIKMEIADPTEQVNDISINFYEIELFIHPDSTGWLPYWCVHRTKGPNDIFTGDISFGNHKNERGIFIPQAMVTTLQKGNSEPWKSEDHTFTWSFEDDLTDEEFTLSHYGLSEPNFGESRVKTFRYILATIGALMIAYALWRMSRNREGVQ